MARQRKKKKFLVRFELGLFGLFSLMVVCFCIFLWMFILGIWAGQTVLAPDGSGSATLGQLAESFFDAPTASSEQSAQVRDEKAVSMAAPKAEKGGGEKWTESEPSFFSLQVAAFRDPNRAARSVKEWRGKGYDAFSQPPEDSGDVFTRVFVGKFAKLADANILVSQLEEKEKVKSYISLVPASKLPKTK